MQERIEYDGELTGTLSEENAAEKEELGVPYSPLMQIWQVNPGAEAVDSADTHKQMADA